MFALNKYLQSGAMKERIHIKTMQDLNCQFDDTRLTAFLGKSINKNMYLHNRQTEKDAGQHSRKRRVYAEVVGSEYSNWKMLVVAL